MQSFAKFRVLSSNCHIKPAKIVGPLREISHILKKGAAWLSKGAAWLSKGAAWLSG
jgi:hypothetical protein